MTFVAIFVGMLATAAASLAFGYWWRGRVDRRTRLLPSGVVAAIDVSLQGGGSVRSDVVVDAVLLERLANGIGHTLVELPSIARH